MIIREVNLVDEASKRRAIQSNLGAEVILRDDHEEWCHCKLLHQGYDNEVYQVQIEDGRGTRQLHYHDLIQLLTIIEHPSHPRFTRFEI